MSGSGGVRGEGPRDRSGAALATAIVLGIVVTLLAHAALLLGQSMRHAGQTELRATREAARLRAEVLAVSAGLDSLGAAVPGSTGSLRLSPELLLIWASEAGLGWANTLWAPEAVTRVRAAEAGVFFAQLPAASVRSRIVPVVEPPASCPIGMAPGSIDRWQLRPEVAESALDFGPVSGARWRPRIPPLPDSLDPARPVAAWVSASTRLVGVAGEGLLWVEGDLRLEGGTTWEGWVAVSGDLTLVGGSVIRGLARIGGELRIDAGSRFEVAVCPLGRAVAALGESLGPPHALRGFSWPVAAGTNPSR